MWPLRWSEPAREPKGGQVGALFPVEEAITSVSMPQEAGLIAIELAAESKSVRSVERMRMLRTLGACRSGSAS